MKFTLRTYSVWACAAVAALVTAIPVSSTAGQQAASTGDAPLERIGRALDQARSAAPPDRNSALEGVLRALNDVDGLEKNEKYAARFLSGEIHFALGDYRNAEKEWKSAGKGDAPFADAARFAVIRTLEARGDNAKAWEEWIAWEAAFPDSRLVPEALLARVWNALRRDKIAEAHRTLNDLTGRYEWMADERRVRLAEATVAFLEGRGERAMSLLAVDDPDAPTLFLRALVHAHNGDVLKAASDFQSVAEDFPASALRDQARLLKADTFLRSGGYKSAAEEFATVVKTASDPAVVREAALGRAASMYLAGDADNSITALREVVSAHPGTGAAARAQFLLGEFLFREARYDVAIVEFNRVLRDYFEHSLAGTAQYRVGLCLDGLGRQAEANAAYQAVVSGYSLSREAPAAAYLAGVGLLEQEKPMAAVPYFQLVLDRYARSDTSGVMVFPSADHQELVEAALCFLELSFHRAGDLTQLSGAPHAMLQKMPPSKSAWRAYALLIDADALAALSRIEEAQQVLSTLIEEFPEHSVGVAANRLLAWTYARQGNDDLAIETEGRMLEEYASTDGGENLGAAFLNKGHILFNRKKYKEAARAYDEFLKRFPNDPQRLLALYQSGLSHSLVGRTGDAVDRWETLVAEDPAAEIAEKAWVRAGDVYFRNEHYDKARTCYEGLLDHFANSAAASMGLLRLAGCAYNTGEDREALEYYSQVVTRFPGSDAAREAESGIEMALYRLGQSGEGTELLVELVDKFPRSSFAAAALMEIGRRLYGEEEYEEAAEAFRKVVSQYPDYSAADKAQYSGAEAYLAMDQALEARQQYEQFLRLFPKSELVPSVKFKLGALRFSDGDYMRAALDFKDVLEAKPGGEMEPAALYNLALCHRMLGNSDEAATMLQQYRRSYPGGANATDVFHQLGVVYQDAGNFEKAAEEFKLALNAKPDPSLEVELLYRLGFCRQQLGTVDRAISTYRQAIRHADKANSYRLSALARCAALYESKSEYKSALKAYRDLAQNATDPELVAAAQERITELEALATN